MTKAVTIYTGDGRIVRPSLTDITEPLFVVYYGNPGTRKTTYAATAANVGRVIWIAAEPGLKSRALRNHGVDTDNIEVFPAPGEELTYDGLSALYWELAERIADNEPIFAIVIDTITEMQSRLIRAAVEAAANKTNGKAQKLLDAGADTEGVAVRSEFDVYLEDYGVVSQQVRKLLRQFASLGIHIVVCAHSRSDKDEDGEVFVHPAVSPSIAADLEGYSDILIHARVIPVGTEEEGNGRTRSYGKFFAKDRYGNLPPVMVDPTFERIYAYNTDQLTRTTDPVQIAAKARRETISSEKTKPTNNKGSKQDAQTAS
jgi:AAA domain